MVKNVLDKIGTLTTISRVKIKNLFGLLDLVFEKSLGKNWRPDNNLPGQDKESPPGSFRGGRTLVQEGEINLLLAQICPSFKFYEILSDFLHKLKVLVELAPKG